MAFNIKLPTWSNKGTKPTKNLANIGFQAGDRGVPASILNWLFHNVFSSITELQTKVTELESSSSILEHTQNTQNPHNVTASQIGAMPITGGTFTGTAKAQASTQVTSSECLANVLVLPNGYSPTNYGSTGTIIFIKEV